MFKRKAMIAFSVAFSVAAMSWVRAMTKAEYDEFVANEEIAELCDESPQVKSAMPPLAIDALVGTWEGVFDIDYYSYNGHRWLSQVASTYKFNKDGTFFFEFPFDYEPKQLPWHERGYIRASGTWEYDAGHLVLDGTIMRQYYDYARNEPSSTIRLNLAVLWFGGNEVAIVPETPSAFKLYSSITDWKSFDGNSVSTGFDDDGFMVVMEKYQVREYIGVVYTVTSPSHYKRTGKRYFGKVAVASKQKDDDIAESRTTEYVVRSGDSMAMIANNQAPVAPSYRITSCTREEGSDFIYKFALELTGEVADPLQAFLDIKQKLRAYVRDMYAGANDVRDISSIRVDFRNESIAGNNISGRAIVLTITPVALNYDANTCRGKLSVRFNANQYEEARAWVRRNIETLARDKNIALVTGEIPPNARFYSLGESLKDGNVLEIEFKTE